MKLADYSPVALPSLDQQRDALEKGLGRATQWAMAGKLDEDLLLDACLHDKRYDRGFNEVRGHWLWNMVQSAHAEDRFRPALLEALHAFPGDDAVQLCELGFHYAEKGDQEFRSRLYQIVQEKPFADARYLGEEEIIRLDGEQAFLFAVRLRGDQLKDREWDWDDSVLMDENVKRLGEERVNGLLEAASDEAIKRFRDAWLKDRSDAEQGDDSGQTLPERMRQIPASEIISVAESAATCPSPRTWGRWAKEEDIETVFQYLLSARDPKIIANCLMVFSSRKFPRILPEVIDLCRYKDGDVRRRAFWALETISHPMVRQLAEAELRNGVPDGLALVLFINNYQTGDEQRILELAELPDNNDQLHYFLRNAKNVCEENSQADCSQLGLVAYALQPCGMCRGSVAELLHERKVAPSWLTEECRFDSEEDTRKLAEQQSHAC